MDGDIIAISFMRKFLTILQREAKLYVRMFTYVHIDWIKNKANKIKIEKTLINIIQFS